MDCQLPKYLSKVLEDFQKGVFFIFSVNFSLPRKAVQPTNLLVKRRTLIEFVGKLSDNLNIMFLQL